MPRQSNFADLLAKIQKSKQNAKEMLVFLSFSSGRTFGIILKYEKPWEIQRFFLRQTKRLLRYYLHRHLDAEESSVVAWSRKGKELSCNHIGIKKQKEAKDRLYFFLFSSFCFPWTVSTDYFPWCSSETVNFLRPLARRLANTRRPFFVAILSRKPCLFTRRRLWGWNVLFIALYYFILLFIQHFGVQKYSFLLNYARFMRNLVQVFAFFTKKEVPLHPKTIQK